MRCTAGGKIGLIDYGQSKRLPDSDRAAFAHLVLAMDRGDQEVRAAVLCCAALRNAMLRYAAWGTGADEVKRAGVAMLCADAVWQPASSRIVPSLHVTAQRTVPHGCKPSPALVG